MADKRCGCRCGCKSPTENPLCPHCDASAEVFGGHGLPVERPAEPENWRAEFCKWCALGSRPTVDGGTVHKVYPMSAGEGAFRHPSITTPLSQYLKCTAPTSEVHIARQAHRIWEVGCDLVTATIANKIEVHNRDQRIAELERNVATLIAANRVADKIIAERDEAFRTAFIAQAALTLATNAIDAIRQGTLSRARAPRCGALLFRC